MCYFIYLRTNTCVFLQQTEGWNCRWLKKNKMEGPTPFFKSIMMHVKTDRIWSHGYGHHCFCSSILYGLLVNRRLCNRHGMFWQLCSQELGEKARLHNKNGSYDQKTCSELYLTVQRGKSLPWCPPCAIFSPRKWS